MSSMCFPNSVLRDLVFGFGLTSLRSFVVIVALAVHFPLFQSIEARAKPFPEAVTKEVSCATPIDKEDYPNLSDRERWAWNDRICLGKSADLYESINSTEKPCDPSKAELWSDPLILTQEFFDIVTKHPTFVNALSQNNLRVRCALIEGNLNLSERDIPYGISLSYSFLPEGISAVDTNIGRSFSLTGSRVEKAFDAKGLNVGGNLFLSEGRFADVMLQGAVIERDLIATTSAFEGPFEADTLTVKGNMDISTDTRFAESVKLLDARIGASLIAVGSEFGGRFSIDRIRVEGALHLRKGSLFHENVVLRGARIGSQVTINDSRVKGELLAKGMIVEGELIADERAEFDQLVELIYARIGGNFRAMGSKFSGKVDAHNLVVNGNVLLKDEAVFRGHIDLTGANVSGNVDLTNSHFHDTVTLTSARIRGALVLSSDGDDCPIWHCAASLNLSSAQALALQDAFCSWRGLDGRIDLTGFEYAQFMRFAVHRGTQHPIIPDRDTSWLVNWLSLQTSFNQQPYEQLATVLRQYGRQDKADEIMIALHDRRRTDELTPKGTKLLLWVEKLTIGYGYSVGRATYWFLAMLILGTFVGYCEKAGLGPVSQNKLDAFFTRLWFSLDRLIPILELDDRHKTIHPSGVCQLYFHVHRILGLIVVTLIAAGLTGLSN